MEFLIFACMVFSIVGILFCIEYIPRTIPAIGVIYAAAPIVSQNMLTRWVGPGYPLIGILALFSLAVTVGCIVEDIKRIKAKKKP